jgi:hypothetical protein
MFSLVPATVALTKSSVGDSLQYAGILMIEGDLYRNRILKIKSYDVLVAKLKEIQPTAGRNKVQKKINMMPLFGSSPVWYP